MRLVAIALVALALVGFADGSVADPPPTVAANAHGRFPHPRRVALLMLENRSYEQVIGNRHAPYLNRLAHRYALGTHFYAQTHPSLPNYMALTGGSKFGFTHNCSTCSTGAPNFVNQLDRAGISWRSYFQSIPATGSRVIRDDNYSAHYNPFTYFDRVRANPVDRAKIGSFDGLGRDIRTSRLARFTWISPDLAHDGHNDSLRTTDRYVSRLVPGLLRALGPRGLLYVSWDEGRRPDHRGVHGSNGGGRIALIAAGPEARRHSLSRRPANQYALLRSLEAGFGLRTLGQAGAEGTPLLTGLVRPSTGVGSG